MEARIAKRAEKILRRGAPRRLIFEVMPLRYAEGLFWAAVVVCVVAQVAIFRSIAAMRSTSARSTGTAGSAPARTRSAAELAWAVIPAIALAAVLFATWRAIHPK